MTARPLVRFLQSFFRRRQSGTAVVSGGYEWHIHPHGLATFGPTAPTIDEWVASGRAGPVKANDQRTVYRVELATGPIYLKQCRVHRPRAWLRDLIRGPKARLEYDNALLLRHHGIDTVQPLAWAKAAGRGPRTSWIVTRGSGAEPFLDLFTRPLTPARRRELARALGGYLARLHDAGVGHPDPHPGNWLVETEGGFRFVLMDLHAVTPGRTLDRDASVANLVRFNRWFQMRATRVDRYRFWLAYVRARRGIGFDRADATRIETETSRSNQRFWAGRYGRYRSNNREFEPVRGPAARGFRYRTLPRTFVDSFLADPDAWFTAAGTKRLKDSRTSTVVEVTIGPRALILKRFNRKSLGHVIKNTLRPSPASRSWALGHNLIDRGLPTPRPLLLAHRYRLGVPVVSYLVVEKVPAAVELAGGVHSADRRRLAADLGRLLRVMHDRHVSHRDLKAVNILLAEGRTPTLIDLVGVRTDRAVPYATRVRDLARLNASFLHSPRISRTDRLRVLTAYLGVLPVPGRTWKTWWTAVDRATRAKAAKNLRTGRPLA